MITVNWFLPTGGDTRWPGVGALSARGDRPATLDYLTQVARSAEQLGFAGVLAPANEWSEDAWLSTAMLAGATDRLGFLVPLQAGLISPVLAACMAATFQRYSGGRLRLLLTPSDDTDEYVRVLVSNAALSRVPPIYLGGPAEVAARHADVHVLDAAPPPAVATHIARVRDLTDRPVRYAIRLHALTRDTSGQAWAEARRLLAALDPSIHNGHLHGGGASKLEVYPNLWAGVALVPGDATLALVGNHAEVADRIEEYHSAGVDEFLLSGHPHLEEAYWFAEGVLPLLRRRGLWQRSNQDPVLTVTGGASR
jgi:alkanesulfonate monooxygenase